MQTATDPIDPRSVLEQLGQLRSGVSSVASAEQALMKSKAERLSVLRREAQRHGEAEAERLNVRMHQLSMEFTDRIEGEQAAVEARAAWIQRAYHASRESLSRRVQRRKDRLIGRVQGDIMRNRQARQEEFEQAASRHQEFVQQLIGDRVVRRDLRKSVLSDFRSFHPWVARWFDVRGKNLGDVTVPAVAEETRAALVKLLAEARDSAAAAGRLPLARIFRFVPFWLLAVVVVAVHAWLGLRAGGGGMHSVLPSLLVSGAVLVTVWLVALLSSLPALRRSARLLAGCRVLEIAAEQQSVARIGALGAEIEAEQAEESRNLGDTFRESDEERKARMREGQQRLDAQFARLPERLERLHQRNFEKLNSARELAITRAREESEARTREFEAAQQAAKSSIEAEVETAMDALADSWRGEVLPVFSRISALDASSRTAFPAWTPETCAEWEPPLEAPPAVRIGRLEVDAGVFTGGTPGDARFPVPGDGKLSTPLALAFPDQASVLIESDGSDAGAATRALHGIALRVLASLPPGRASFVFIDPVGLGKDFAGLMHLADYEETLITHRIWTQGTHIEERLAEVNEHIEKVIQMYLRDEFPDITEYNKQAGTIAEKYRFVVIAGFPAGFSETSAKRLLSIASSGARCGVHLLIQRDLRQSAPDPALEDELRRTCHRLVFKDGGFHLSEAPAGADAVVFDPLPSHQDSITLVHRIGRANIDSNRVQVPFAQIAPPEDEVWKTDTGEELRVPIGRTGAKKLQMLAIGKGTRQHMLLAGKTGSGKSTLFHVIITNLALWCSPEQVEFYLVDFKKGVEFKCYAAKRLPHARVVAIESDREFALSVLQRVDAELKRRGELFRHAGTQDLAGYKRSGGGEEIPRTLLLIDEFQEFFTEDDAVAQEASLLLDRIVRQGRAFGIHVILGSQTLGGAYTLARATLGQMVIRVALQCNETDAHLIMDDDNPAPRLLTRPGEGIYNDQAGALAANSPFQIVWLPEDERDAVLDRVSALAAKAKNLPPPPIVFEGNAPADVRDNLQLTNLIHERPAKRPRSARAWLGAPNSIKGPTEAVFQRQSGSHLLAVGQSTERSLSLLVVSLVALAAQYPDGEVRFVVLEPHGSEADADGELQKLAATFPERIRIGGPAEVSELMAGLEKELADRAPTSGRDAPEVFLIVHELQRFKALRPDDEFKFSMDDEPAAASPSKVFADLLGEGGPCGMHVLATTDTWNNVSRWIPRKLMAEFEMRVLYQMSANDSANLIDSPAATTLGLHRALFYNEHLGTLETFRPYAMPDAAWLEDVGAL